MAADICHRNEHILIIFLKETRTSDSPGELHKREISNQNRVRGHSGTAVPAVRPCLEEMQSWERREA